MKEVAEIIKNFSLAGEIVDIASMNSDFYKDDEDTPWRVYRFIDQSHTQNNVEDPKTLYNAGVG